MALAPSPEGLEADLPSCSPTLSARRWGQKENKVMRLMAVCRSQLRLREDGDETLQTLPRIPSQQRLTQSMSPRTPGQHDDAAPSRLESITKLLKFTDTPPTPSEQLSRQTSRRSMREQAVLNLRSTRQYIKNAVRELKDDLEHGHGQLYDDFSHRATELESNATAQRKREIMKQGVDFVSRNAEAAQRRGVHSQYSTEELESATLGSRRPLSRPGVPSDGRMRDPVALAQRGQRVRARAEADVRDLEEWFDTLMALRRQGVVDLELAFAKKWSAMCHVIKATQVLGNALNQTTRKTWNATRPKPMEVSFRIGRTAAKRPPRRVVPSSPLGIARTSSSGRMLLGEVSGFFSSFGSAESSPLLREPRPPASSRSLRRHSTVESNVSNLHIAKTETARTTSQWPTRRQQGDPARGEKGFMMDTHNFLSARQRGKLQKLRHIETKAVSFR